MPRGRSWTQEEVSRLLALVEGSGEVALLMGSTSRPNEALWQEISQGLVSAGYERTVAQCRSKWKALKQAFHWERETRQKDGCHPPSLSPYYGAMKSIWKAGGRPAFGERRMSGLVKLPRRKRRSTRADHSSSTSELPASSGDHVAGVSPAPLAMPRSHTSSKQKGAQQKPDVPGETSLEMGDGNQMLPVATTAQSSPRTAAVSEHPADEEALDASLHSFSESSLLQSVHRLLEQILESSRQQQVLLEGLASNTTSYLQLVSRSLAQMGETLHQILLQPQIHRGHYVPHVSLFEGDSEVLCSPGTPHTSLDDKQDPQMSPATGCTPP